MNITINETMLNCMENATKIECLEPISISKVDIVVGLIAMVCAIIFIIHWRCKK